MIDQRLIGAFDHIAAWLQKEHGIPMPSILKNAMMAVITSMILKIIFEAFAGAFVSLTLDLLISTFLGRRIAQRFIMLARHEEATWNARLAATYQASAIANREMRLARAIRLILVLSFVLFDIPTIVHMAIWGPTPGGLVGVALTVSLIAYLYFACAMPHTPSRREKRETFFEAAPSAA